MSISVFIAHFAPNVNMEYYRNILKKTIKSIRCQEVNFDVEIIVCDDGSAWSAPLVNSEDECIREFDGSQIRSLSLLNDLDVNRYLLLPDSGKYLGIKLKHRAFEIAKNDKIVVLDDDHPFLRKDSLARYSKYLDKYEFVRGRVIGPTGIPQLFLSKNAQGTNYGLLKELYFSFGGFADFLFENGNGEDVDILWQIYHKLKEKFPEQKAACFAGEIVTRDLASNRWVNRANIDALQKLKDENGKDVPYKILFQKKFMDRYGVYPHDNLSRKKRLWMEIPSLESWLSEMKYAPIAYTHPDYVRGLFKNLLRFWQLVWSKDGREKIAQKLVSIKK